MSTVGLGVLGAAWGCRDPPIPPPSQVTWGSTCSMCSPWCSAPGSTGGSGGMGWPLPVPGSQVGAAQLGGDPWGVGVPFHCPCPASLPRRDANRCGRAGALEHKQWGLWYVVPCGLRAGSAPSSGVPESPRLLQVSLSSWGGHGSWGGRAHGAGGHTGSCSPMLEGLGRTGSLQPAQCHGPSQGRSTGPCCPPRSPPCASSPRP